jgi:Ca2+-binding RTX toxin-like protein
LPITNPHICHPGRESEIGTQGNPESEKPQHALDGGSGADLLRGGGGNDVLSGRAENDTMFGGDGDDRMSGDNGADQMDGGAGNDTMEGGADNDAMDGGFGNDSVSGGLGNDFVRGGAGNDSLIGGDGNDTLEGGAGDDRLVGDNSDVMTGGADVDTFVVETTADGSTPLIQDLDAANETLVINLTLPQEVIDLGATTVSLEQGPGDSGIFVVANLPDGSEERVAFLEGISLGTSLDIDLNVTAA